MWFIPKTISIYSNRDIYAKCDFTYVLNWIWWTFHGSRLSSCMKDSKYTFGMIIFHPVVEESKATSRIRIPYKRMILVQSWSVRGMIWNIHNPSSGTLHRRKLTWQWKNAGITFNRWYIFKRLFFRCHLSFPGCILSNKDPSIGRALLTSQRFTRCAGYILHYSVCFDRSSNDTEGISPIRVSLLHRLTPLKF